MPFLDSLALGCPTPTGHLARWHLVVQLYDLALGCPTLRRSQLYDMLLRRHNCAQHAFRSICCTYYLISLDELHTGCDTIWHLLFIRSDGYMWYIIDIFYFVYMIWLTVSIHHQRYPLHSMLINMMSFFPRLLLLFGCEFIGTPVDSDFYLFHSMYISTLRYLAAPDVMSSRYSIIWSRSSQCLMILSGSIHHHVEPFVICWLYGSHVMIWATLCCCCASSLFQNCYTHGNAQSLPGVPSWNVITMSCSSTCYYHGL